jgi:hypothetical protein
MINIQKNKEYPRDVNDSCFVFDDNDKRSKNKEYSRDVNDLCIVIDDNNEHLKTKNIQEI